MITDINQLDSDKLYTYADYLTWQFQERVELIKGKIFKMSPAPRRKHQEISGSIYRQAANFLLNHKNCNIYSAPFDVRLPVKSKKDEDVFTVVQPDICVVCDIEKLDDAGCIGAPDLIIEILSKSTSKKDLKDKYQLYEENGVQEYWIVYPNEAIVDLYLLENSKYILEGKYIPEDKISSKAIKNLTIDLNLVFED